jgi:hypothetical protein
MADKNQDDEDRSLLTQDLLATSSLTGALDRHGERAHERMLTESMLPRKVNQQYDNLGSLERMGFEIGTPVDRLFVKTKLPEGWQVKEEAGSYMHSDLLDDKGRNRGHIFSCPKPYDAEASLSLRERFSLGISVSSLEDGKAFLHIQLDDACGAGSEVNSIHQVVPPADLKHRKANKKIRDATDRFSSDLQRKTAEVFDRVFPDHNDPAAYWNDDVSAKRAELSQTLRAMVVDMGRKEDKAPPATEPKSHTSWLKKLLPF